MSMEIMDKYCHSLDNIALFIYNAMKQMNDSSFICEEQEMLRKIAREFPEMEFTKRFVRDTGEWRKQLFSYIMEADRRTRLGGFDSSG